MAAAPSNRLLGAWTSSAQATEISSLGASRSSEICRRRPPRGIKAWVPGLARLRGDQGGRPSFAPNRVGSNRARMRHLGPSSRRVGTFADAVSFVAVPPPSDPLEAVHQVPAVGLIRTPARLSARLAGAMEVSSVRGSADCGCSNGPAPDGSSSIAFTPAQSRGRNSSVVPLASPTARFRLKAPSARSRMLSECFDGTDGVRAEDCATWASWSSFSMAHLREPRAQSGKSPGPGARPAPTSRRAATVPARQQTSLSARARRSRAVAAGPDGLARHCPRFFEVGARRHPVGDTVRGTTPCAGRGPPRWGGRVPTDGHDLLVGDQADHRGRSRQRRRSRPRSVPDRRAAEPVETAPGSVSPGHSVPAVRPACRTALVTPRPMRTVGLVFLQFLGAAEQVIDATSGATSP